MKPTLTPLATLLASHSATRSVALLATLLASLCGGTALAQLQPQAERIQDEAIQADHKTYALVQGRIKALNDTGLPIATPALSKAQCWLDVSFHEYTRNDRGPFPQAALLEADKLLQALERKLPPNMHTPLVGEAVRLREDLWARTAALHQHAGFACAAAKAACAEVELVHAGNEHAQLAWRHAKPYVQLAEELVADAEALAQACPAPVPAPAPAPVPAVVPPAAAPVVPPAPPAPASAPLPMLEERLLSTDLVFAFDKHGEADIHPPSRAQFDALLARLRSEGWQVRAVTLSGHADRLNSTGASQYNQRLSERRAATARALLLRFGLAEGLIRTEARGDGTPVQSCTGIKPGPALQACLLPNRRVEVRLQAQRAAR